MRRIRTLLFFGIWIAILPYLGFPYFWRNVLFTVSGMVLIGFAYVLYAEHNKRNRKNGGRTFENFSENRNFEVNTNSKSTQE